MGEAKSTPLELIATIPMRQLFKYITIGFALAILPIVMLGAITRFSEDSKENSPSQSNEFAPKRHESKIFLSILRK